MNRAALPVPSTEPGLSAVPAKVVTELPGPKSRALHERRHAVVSAGLTQGFPIYIERAEGAILLDVDGNHILDLGSGIAVTSIGHAVPELVDAVSAQVAGSIVYPETLLPLTFTT